MLSKPAIIDAAVALLKEKRKTLSGLLDAMDDALETASKSVMGDKHETARAKMHIEQDQLREQLYEVNQQLAGLARIDAHAVYETIFQGAVVQTNGSVFFLSVPMGRIEVEGSSVRLISTQSPIGRLMMGLRRHDTFSVNGVPYRIENFY